MSFFLRSFQQINSKFKYLFQEHINEQDTDGRGVNEFIRSFGWLYNCKMVSELEGISIADVYGLGVYQFLNDLSYIKMKREVDAENERNLLNKQRMNAKH